jgi:hypothetical protein
LKRWATVSREKTIKSKNVETIYSAAQTVSKNEGVPLNKITIHSYYRSGTEIRWQSPETDVEFARREKSAAEEYKRDLKWYEKAKKEYDEYQTAQDLGSLGKAVNDHEAAVNTIAEVLKKYPDVLDKAVAKAVKGK